MYEVWHNETNNIIDWFDTADEADEAISAAVRENGVNMLSGMYMAHVDADGKSHFVADDEAILVAIKRLAAAEREEVSHLTGPDRRMG